MTEFDRELPEGYKMTELGPLPEEWEVVKLGDVAYIKYGKAKPKDTGNIPVVGSGGIYSYTSKALIDYPTIIVGRKGTAGKAWLFLKPCYPSDTTFYLSWKKQVDVSFIFHYLTLHPLSGEHAKTTLPSLQKSELEEILIPLPPLPEQRKIAAVLSTVQEAKEKAEAVISAARDLKKSMMSYLFTYGPVPLPDAENVPQKETEIGMIPEEWEVVKLGDVAEVKGGKRLPKGHSFSSVPTTYPYIRITDFSNWSVRTTELKYLTAEDREAMRKYIITTDDVYISIAGTIGIVGTIPPELDGANLTENAARLIILDSERLDKSFLVGFLASKQGQYEIRIRTSKTSQPKLALNRVKQIPIPLPPLPEQQKIASMLSAIDEKIEAEENKKKALEDLFNTLLHNLMTARIRVNHLALDKAELAM